MANSCVHNYRHSLKCSFFWENQFDIFHSHKNMKPWYFPLKIVTGDRDYLQNTFFHLFVMIQKHTSNLHVIFWDMHQTRLASFISNRVKPQRGSMTNDVYRTSKQSKTFEDEKKSYFIFIACKIFLCRKLES